MKRMKPVIFYHNHRLHKLILRLWNDTKSKIDRKDEQSIMWLDMFLKVTQGQGCI